jgi:hypothetical protein
VQYTYHLPINFGDSHFLPFCFGEFTSWIVCHKQLDGSKGTSGAKVASHERLSSVISAATSASLAGRITSVMPLSFYMARASQ